MTTDTQEAPQVDQPIPAAGAADTVEVGDLDSFVRHLVGWHSSRKATVQHFLQLPEGSAFQVGDGPDAKTITVEGDVMAGFKFGIELALMQLGTLPFVVELEAEEADATGG